MCCGCPHTIVRVLQTRLGVVGDKAGSVGSLVVGDSSGRVYILKVKDVVQLAEVQRAKDLEVWSNRAMFEVRAPKLSEPTGASFLGSPTSLANPPIVPVGVAASSSPTGQDPVPSSEAKPNEPDAGTAPLKRDVIAFASGHMAQRLVAPRPLASQNAADAQVASSILSKLGFDMEHMGEDEKLTEAEKGFLSQRYREVVPSTEFVGSDILTTLHPLIDDPESVSRRHTAVAAAQSTAVPATPGEMATRDSMGAEGARLGGNANGSDATAPVAEQQHHATSGVARTTAKGKTKRVNSARRRAKALRIKPARATRGGARRPFTVTPSKNKVFFPAEPQSSARSTGSGSMGKKRSAALLSPGHGLHSSRRRRGNSSSHTSPSGSTRSLASRKGGSGAGDGGARDHAGDSSEDENEAAAAELKTMTEDAVTRVWRRPRGLLCIFGGAGGLHDVLVPNLRVLLSQGALKAATVLGCVMLDGGTDSGVMKMVGGAVGKSQERTVRVVGCCPQGITRSPCDPLNSSLVDLEPRHTDFVLVPSSDWGGETTTMFSLAATFLAKIPGVAVLANGGQISKKEVRHDHIVMASFIRGDAVVVAVVAINVLRVAWRQIVHAVRHALPVVIISGSGRLADTVSREFLARRESPDQWDPEDVEDEGVREIVEHGNVRLSSIKHTYNMFTGLTALGCCMY